MLKFLPDERAPTRYAILSDSAFVANTPVTNGKIVRGLKASEMVTFDSPELAAVDLIMQRIMPSERSTAEWRVQTLKRTVGCLRLPLSPDSRRRARLLTVYAHLLNLQSRRIGLSKIRTVYVSSTTDVQP